MAQEGEVVNIFAIASGHMYERLQKIMILSVLQHTKAKVKFWLIKNYMSPEMKRMMPLMAEKFGFEVLATTLSAYMCVSVCLWWLPYVPLALESCVAKKSILQAADSALYFW